MLRKLLDEPVALTAALQAVLVCAAGFGLQMSAEQIAALVGVFSAILALVVRQAVASPAAVVEAVTDAAVSTAERLTEPVAGVAGQVTGEAGRIVGGVIHEVVRDVGGLVPRLAHPKAGSSTVTPTTPP